MSKSGWFQTLVIHKNEADDAPRVAPKVYDVPASGKREKQGVEMAEDRKERYEREKKAKEYKDFMDWAAREVANEVMRSGFANIRSCLTQILQVYEQGKKTWL